MSKKKKNKKKINVKNPRNRINYKYVFSIQIPEYDTAVKIISNLDIWRFFEVETKCTITDLSTDKDNSSFIENV